MNSAWLLVVSAIVCGHLALVEGYRKTPWKPCASSNGIKIIDVDVQGCNGSPCKIKLGTDTLFSYTFEPANTYKNLTQEVCGEIAGECIPFPDQKFGNMCDCPGCTLSKKCPFESGTTYNMTVEVPVSAAFPEVTTVAVWSVKDPSDGNKVIGCFDVPVQTVKEA